MNSADDCSSSHRQTTTLRFSGHRTYLFSLLIHARHAAFLESECASSSREIQLWNNFLFLPRRTFEVFRGFDGNDGDLLFHSLI